mmetsp:Transcript_44437/g.101881  ORF Transcript_44437/g.101881 Transcript_44437/m.101881 type:complete len:103 (-) Transcript_44437:515-823(-)
MSGSSSCFSHECRLSGGERQTSMVGCPAGGARCRMLDRRARTLPNSASGTLARCSIYVCKEDLHEIRVDWYTEIRDSSALAELDPCIHKVRSGTDGARTARE